MTSRFIIYQIYHLSDLSSIRSIIYVSVHQKKEQNGVEKSKKIKQKITEKNLSGREILYTIEEEN